MNKDKCYHDWRELRVQIKMKFKELNDVQIDGLQNHEDRLKILLMKVYKYDEARAELECTNFYNSLETHNKSRLDRSTSDPCRI